jgi:hypothetical protein
MVLLKVISKNGMNWEDTQVVVDTGSAEDIKNQFYAGSRKWPEFFPSFLFVVERKDDVVFMESVINVLKGLSIDNDLQDEDYQEQLYKKLSKNYPDLTKDHYLNAILYVLTEPEDRADIVEAILEQTLVAEAVEEPEEEEEEENIEPYVNVLRFKTSFGKIYADPVNLQEIYDGLLLNENLILAKSFYGNAPEYLSNGLSVQQQKVIDNFVYSEHFTGKKEKILTSGVINFLMYMNNSVISGRISDLGIVGLKIEPKMMKFSNYNFTELKNNLKLFYGNLEADFKTFEIKVVYPTGFGYYPKQIIANTEGTEVKNEKVEFILEEKRVWYSSAGNAINFTVKNINTELDITKTFEIINKRVEWYSNNLLKIKSIKKLIGDKLVIFLEEPHFFTKKNEYVKILTGFYKVSEFTSSSITINTIDKLDDAKTIMLSGPRKKQSVKLLRKLGLNVNSKECEKSRRPVLLSKDDPSVGENILELNGRKFKCMSPYNYHGIINKTNCCYKTKQTNVSVTAVKRKPLKLFDKLKKGSTKLLEGTFIDYLDAKFTLKTPEDLPKDRTIKSCLVMLYGSDIVNEALDNLTDELYGDYFKNGMDLITWKNVEAKSIDDIILAVSIYKNVNILLFLDNAIEGLYTKCRNFLNFDKYSVIYKSTQKIDSYYLLNKGDVLEFKEAEIQDLVDISKNACKSGFSESVYTFKSIVKAQVFDYQNLVVFVELLSGGYVPVSPSTIDLSIDSYSITSEKFVLLKPEAQYNSLLSVSTAFPQLTPIGLTKILDEDITTSIKLKNGAFSPVSHMIWDTVLLPKVDDLFYIQTYGSEQDEFVDEELAFKKNLEEFYKIADIELLNKNVENYDYTEVINMVKILNVSEDETSRLSWYLINNN